MENDCLNYAGNVGLSSEKDMRNKVYALLTNHIAV